MTMCLMTSSCVNTSPAICCLTRGGAAFQGLPSLDRVNEVKKYLSSHGINGGRISTEGFGDTQPIASNDQEETRMKNRRVEFTITKK